MRLERVEIDPAATYPDFLEGMVEAARSGEDVVAAIDSTVRALGFNTFMYGCSATWRPDMDSKIWTFTTLPIEWVREYEENSYIEVDVRVQGLFKSAIPVIWDQSERGKNARVDQFLTAASKYGTRSGISMRVADSDTFSCGVCYNSTTPILDSMRRKMLLRQQGDLMAFGVYFHQLFMKPLILKGLAPTLQGAALSLRECETLRWLVQGLSYDEVAERMGITPRTVQAHTDAIRSKLNANSTNEAIFLATKGGLLNFDPARSTSYIGSVKPR
jgi:DNA-binding CsgD family transcriptional regulator